MGKSISGSALYEIKVTNPNSISNYDAGKLTKAIGDDFSAFMGKPTQGLVVKAGEATKIIDKVKKDMVAKKVQQPWIRAGLSGNDVIFLVTDLKGKYEQACTLVANYIPLREKLKKQEGMVVNLDKGDKVIDQAAKDMAKVQNTKAVEGKDAKFGGITGKTPIILLAHGDEDKTASGQIYGKDFAGKTPQQIVALLTENKDEKKRLSPDYSGTIYLDGCFTAQGGAMQNYTKQVWDLLKAKGIKNVVVKGNLGAAATLKSGDELVTTTEAEEEEKRLTKAANQQYQAFIKSQQAKMKPIWDTKYKAKNDKANFDKDPEIVKLRQEIQAKKVELGTKLSNDIKKIPGMNVKNLVGNFGLQRLN